MRNKEIKYELYNFIHQLLNHEESDKRVPYQSEILVLASVLWKMSTIPK
jgi:hypothetical protein